MSSTALSNTGYFLLIDCDQFFVSCECLFEPRLLGRPVVVLSNNDGCVIARSKEAKALKIPMGAPAFQYRDFFKKQGVTVFSSNFALYGDMSKRVMQVLSTFGYPMEEYSIDESFLQIDHPSPLDLAQEIRKKVLTWTGIPVSIGIGKTKTLAKVASDLAKKKPEHVFFFENENSSDAVLKKLRVEEIWGVGSRLKESLRAYGITTAFALKNAPDDWIKKQFSVTTLRCVWELRGIPCLTLDDSPCPRQSITYSRSFGAPITMLPDLMEALASYTANAAEKLRGDGLIASFVTVFILTSPFRKHAYANSITHSLVEPTAYTPLLLKSAQKGLERIYRDGYIYKKVGVTLGGLLDATCYQKDLFTVTRPKRSKQTKVMQIMDSLNENFDRKTLQFASEGLGDKKWKMKHNENQSTIIHPSGIRSLVFKP